MKKNDKFVQNISFAENAIKEGEAGTLLFTKPLAITDNSEQRNGTRYDIKSMDMSEYNGTITADHSWSIQSILGKVLGLTKKSNKITIDGIKFAIDDNALALYAHNMMKAGLITDVSIETYGPYPDDEGVYKNSRLVGLSIVVTGNNKSARLNSQEHKQIVLNSLEQAKQEGLDTKDLQEQLDKNYKLGDTDSMKIITVLNNQEFEVTVSYKNAAGDMVKRALAPKETIDVSEDQKEAVENQITSAQAPKAESIDVAEAIKNAVDGAIKPLAEKMEKLEESAFNSTAVEPRFQKTAKVQHSSDKAELEAMDYTERHGLQINKAWDMLKGGNAKAGEELRVINEFHLEKLKEAGVVKNTITIADMGSFVISPELISEIEGHRSNFAPLLSRLDWKETLSLQMAWLNRVGDINMQPVEMCDDDADGNLKPISEYTATITTKNLEELAAVTPVCNAATRFLAADLLGDVAQGYRTDYDRKRAQLFIARMQQAVNATGNVATYTTTSDLNSLKSWVDMVAEISNEIDNGVFVLSNASRWELIKRAIGSGISGDVLGILKSGDLTPILGAGAIVVPNELLPTLNTAQTKSFSVDGESVTINKAVFYVDLSTFTGRTSGGLQYDLSTDAAYEDGEDVKSAFQRNELVLRGSFFRGGAIKDTAKVAAMGAPGVS